MRITRVRQKKVMRRPCRACGAMFHPTGKFNRMCDDCIDKSYERAIKKRKAKGKWK